MSQCAWTWGRMAFTEAVFSGQTLVVMDSATANEEGHQVVRIMLPGRSANSPRILPMAECLIKKFLLMAECSLKQFLLMANISLKIFNFFHLAPYFDAF